MTNKEEAILNIKETLKRLMAFGKSEMKCEDMMLKDGSTISVEEGKSLEVGLPLYKKDEKGNLTPCPDGEYELEDGRKVKCLGGMVEAISETATPSEVEAGSPASEAKMEETEISIEPSEGETESEGSDMESRVKALEEQISQILEMMKGMAKMQEETMSKVETFAASPAEEPIKNEKKVADVWSKTKATRKAFASEIDELKKLMNKSDNSYGSFSVGQ